MNSESLLTVAKDWGFLCHRDREGNWQILPPQPTQGWKLQQVVDRWLLFVANVAQVNLYPHEAKDFLERRHRACLHEQ